MPHTLTVFLVSLLSIGVFLVGYDIFLVEKYGVVSTISWQTLQFCKQNPITVVFVGLILGILERHLFTDRAVQFLSWNNPFVPFLLATLTGWALSSFWVQRGGQ